MKKAIKVSKFILAIGLIACLFIKYASFKYFTLPIDYYIYQVSVLRELLLLTSVVIFIEVFGKIKWINNYVAMVLIALTLFSWLDFYNDYKVIKIIDVTNEVINIYSNSLIFSVLVVLVILLIVYLIDLIIKKTKTN